MIDVAAYLVFFLCLALIYGLVCLGLNLQWGFAGLFNVGVVGFFVVGAYTVAILSSPAAADRVGGFGVPVPLALLAAMAAAGLVAFVVGIPTLRLREDYLAIATFGIAVTIQLVALNWETLTGGTHGRVSIPRPLASVFVDRVNANLFFLAITLAIVAAAYWALERMVRSPWGRVLRAIREDEVAAGALGKNAFVYRLQAFVIGSALMGLGGGLYASFIGYVGADDALPTLTFQIWVMLIVGGSGNNKGALIGAVSVWGLWSFSGWFMAAVLPSAFAVRAGALQVILIGLVLASVLLLRPKGLVGEEAVVSRGARVE
ncbi:MAG: branched-chain amino acid ABC transporter permease [Alphaproteobacteria bacterium]